jgi:hypothetical protein
MNHNEPEAASSNKTGGNQYGIIPCIFIKTYQQGANLPAHSDIVVPPNDTYTITQKTFWKYAYMELPREKIGLQKIKKQWRGKCFLRFENVDSERLCNY